MKNNSKKIRFIMLFYILVVLCITQYSPNVNFNVNLSNIHVNLVPFTPITDAIKEINENRAISTIEVPLIHNIIFVLISSFGLISNIILFIPFGALLPVICTNINKLYKIFILGFLFSLLLELLQIIPMVFLTSYSKVFDIDDLIANTLGAVLGYYALKFIRKYNFSNKTKKHLHTNSA